jgi:CPA2 family monovalent cation:H+ antiporter-2
LLVRQADAFGVEPETTRWVFWIAITVVVLVPLVAIWRIVATVAMIVAESLRWGTQLETGIKGIAAVVLGFWLYALLPTDQLGAWGWIVIGVAAAVFVGFFSKRLIYWHSQWQSSVREVLATDADAAALPAAEQTRRRLGPRLDTWDVRLGECILPDGATFAGRTLADLSIPSQFGCAILEVERNGIVITAIRPDLRLYPGDKLLLLGQAKQIGAACEFLSREKALDDQAEEFRGSVLETFHVPAGPWDGRTLAELKLAQVTGVRVVGIHRGAERIIAPSGDERLHGGDDVLVAGTLKEIASFRRWLTSPAVAEGGPALPTGGVD